MSENKEQEAPKESISEVDWANLEVARSKKQVTLEEAKAALARSETADIAYKYRVLQIYMKYGLTTADVLGENGVIIRNGAQKTES